MYVKGGGEEGEQRGRMGATLGDEWRKAVMSMYGGSGEEARWGGEGEEQKE
jgi:hypothetical protein